MKLTQISAKNFQGESFTLDLSPINFLVGGNFKGKTTRLNAIRLFLLGYLPEQGKTNEATFRLSSGREMEVSGTFDNGETGVRRWRAKGNSISKEEQMPKSFTDSVKELVAFMMDSDTYFSLSETKRVEYVARNMDLGGTWTPAAIIARVEKALGEQTKETEAVAHALSALKYEPVQEFVSDAIEMMADTASAAKAHAAKMEKTAQGLAALRANDDPTIDVGTYDRQIADLEAEIQTFIAERERHNAAAKAAKAAEQRRADLTQAIGAKARVIERQQSLTMKIETAQSQLEAHPAPTRADIDAMRTSESEARLALRDHEKDLKAVEEMIRVNETALADLDHKEHCPYCGAAGHGWKDTKRDEIVAAIRGLKTKSEQLRPHVAELKTHVEKLTARIGEARAERDAVDVIDRDLSNLKRELADTEGLLQTLAAKEEELARIPEADMSVVKAVDAAQTEINVRNDRITVLKRDRDTVLGRKSELQRLAQAETDRDAAKREQAAAEQAAEELREVQSEMVAEAFKPLLSEANVLFLDAMPFLLEYNADKAEIGRRRDGVWVSHKTFSGVEKLLTYAAIQMALAARSPVRIMILDEMRRAEGEVFDRVVDACKQAVRERGIDQFLGVIPGNPEDYTHLFVNESDCQVVPIA